MLKPVLGLPSLSGNPIKGLNVTLSISTDTPGLVTFFVSGKKIGNCISKATTGTVGNYSASCYWKPSIQGAFQITARIKPTDSSYQIATSGILSVGVAMRATKR